MTQVDGFRVEVIPKADSGDQADAVEEKLFFINLGGYLQGRFEEQHYTVLTAKINRADAIKAAKQTLFYEHNTIPGGVSHVDDKYGIDVDDIYRITDILSPAQKAAYHIRLVPADEVIEDEVHLGYLALEKIGA